VPRKRQRSAKACLSCRQTKKKCDGKNPCSTCARFHHECLYQKGKTFGGLSSVQSVTSTSEGGNAHGEVTGRAVSTYSHPAQDTGMDHHSILDPEKGRYFDDSSAIAFPRLVGIQFGASKAPRLHSFAWNLGIRPEPVPSALDITQFVPLDDVYLYSKDYFAVVHPTFDFLDQQEFIRRASLRWKGSSTEESLNFDAVICGVVALGYFVSKKSDSGIEAVLTMFAKDRLESVALTKPPTIDLISAWILRAIYLRATSRPHASWMASNITMHLIESSGIQRDISSVTLVYPSSRQVYDDEAQALYRRRVFWVGRAVNALLSYEYSRPRVVINNVTCARVDSLVSSSTRDLLRLVDLIPEHSHPCADAVEFQETTSMIKSLEALTMNQIPVSLFRTDLAFAAFRHLRPLRSYSTHSALNPVTSSRVLKVGSAALKVIDKALSSPPAPSPRSTENPPVTPWWSLISIPFHFILILLALDTPDSLSLVSSALQTLNAVAGEFDTHLTREAVQNATTLIRLAQSRKIRDLDALKCAVGSNLGIQATDATERAQSRRESSKGTQWAGAESAELSMSTQQLQTQPLVDNRVRYNSGLGMDMGGPGTGMFDGMVKPYNMDVDWDAIFQNTDWL
jgi:hypothetical protein